ncbi:ABC transporter permease [Anaeropeptidivorans aminofermentans]|jgi:simple sugar transport system permease protein|uniref:ABC transporter permease n=1 Tax=Anaeropeptidivorans aminofermentans TaxID=2934315 RepID=UPI0020250871|nr:ABC transporter permease [Anaeropeptidivorans aminofermentans]MBE6012552.1 ABC transporter permease [Lachnospiraceae bacterium]
MKDLLALVFSPFFAYSIIRLTTPILFATLAAMLTQRAGITNMAIEGTMLFAALFGVIGSAVFGNAFAGLVCAIVTGLVISIMLSYFTVKLKADMYLACIAMNLFASGGTIFILFTLTGDKSMSSSLASKVMPTMAIPLLHQIPILGEIFSGHNILTYVAFIMVIVVHIVLFKLPLGLQIRAVGENPDAASSVGISVSKIRFISLLLCGLLAGLGGAYMSMGYMSMFTRDMVAGRGFFGLAASNIGGQSPIGGMFAALLFGFFDSVANNMQRFDIPANLIQAIPYIATVVFLGISSYKKMLDQKVKRK